MNNSWIFLNQPTPFIDELYSLARTIEYNITPNGLIRSTVPADIEQKICKFYNLDLEVGIYKTPPGWQYKFHRDNTRNCALNQLLCDPNDNYVNQMLVNGELKNIPYKTDRLCLINTSELHNVQNNTTDNIRYLLNITIKNFIKFEIIENHLRNNGFI
jgi:phosphatidylserine decarboxylase